MPHLIEEKMLPSGQFADPANRKFPVRDQVDVDRAAAALSGPRGQAAARRKLVELARARNLLLPASFAAEVVEFRKKNNEYGYFEKPLDPDNAAFMGSSDAGVAALFSNGLKPDPEKFGTGSTVNFSEGSGSVEMSDDEETRILMSSETGREVLKRRGMTDMQMYEFRNNNRHLAC